MRQGPAAAAFLLFLGAIRGQILTSGAVLTGFVRDQSGNPIAGAAITVRDSGKGITNTTRSGTDGDYRLPLLLPSVYDVEIAAQGYAPASFKAVRLSVGETTKLDASLLFISARFSVDVTATAPVLDFDRSHQASVIVSERIENLPINRRDYLDFALLTPGVSGSSTVANAFDFRSPVAPTSGISFAGSTGRGNNFSIDGVENNGNTGNVRLSLPQTAVQEFQVNRNSYPAEYGGGYGGALNIVSKSGTNSHHGEIFGYLRHRDIQARNFFDPTKSPYTRVQSGANAGGPLRKDRLHYYAAFERLDAHQSAFVPILSDRTFLSRLSPGQQDIVNVLSASGIPQLAGGAALLRSILIPSNNPQTGALFEANSGVFPFHTASSVGSLRLDASLSEGKKLFFRANGGQQEIQNSRFGAQSGYTRGNTTEAIGGTAVVSYVQHYNPHWTGISRVAFAYDGTSMTPNDPLGPAIDISGFGSFGRDQVYPFQKYERHIQVQQGFDFFRSRHVLKFGVDLNPLRGNGRLSNAIGGRFTFGEFVPLSLLLASTDPTLPANLAAAVTALGRSDLVARLDDPINSLQAYSLGLPVAYLQGFGSGNVPAAWQKRFSAFVDDSYRVHPSLTLTAGLRFQSDAISKFPVQNFLDPRVGFAWSPGRKADLVIRGGYGIYHSWVESQIVFLANSFLPPLSVDLLFVPITGLPGTVNPLTGLPLTSVDIYRSLQSRGILGRRSIEFNDLAQLGIRPGFKFPASGGLDSNYQAPGAQHASLQIERSLGSFILSAGYDFSRVAHLPRIRDHNLYLAGTRPDGNPIFGRYDPAIFTNFVVESTGNSFYHALTLQFEKRLRRYASIHAHYTFSKAIDDVSDFDPDFAPHNQLDARAERALSTFHQQHRFVSSAVFETLALPNRAGFARRIAGGWTFSPIVTASSFRPFNVLAGYDNMGDGVVNTHRPLGAGRNIGIGPNYFSVDARVSRKFTLRKDSGWRLQFIGEVFNLLNRTNFEAVNNIVGGTPLTSLPRPIQARVGYPIEPLSFTSARDPRQFQFGLKVGF